ncbi:RIP metalloprotease RseP [bacterium]|nr:RIP metalloprotease RseP [bacterium]
MITFLATVFVLGILVFIHELGHYGAAKLFKIRVDRFSLGFPPRLFGRKIGETDYCISAIPIGGYVKIAGMVDESMDVDFVEGPPQPWEFRSRSWIQKVIVISAGSFMNLLMAFMIFWGVAFFNGVAEVPEPWYDHVTVLEGTPADSAGLKSGDRILTVNGDSVHTWDQITNVVYPSAGKPLEFTWNRGDTLYTRTIVPRAHRSGLSDDEQPIGLIGLQLSNVMRKTGFFESLRFGWDEFVFQVRLFFVSWKRLLSGKESIRSLAGPVKIAEMAGETARYGFATLLGFLALIGINLGLLNLLPIPVLDGGHLVYIHLEALIRRTIPIKTKLVIQQMGMILIFGLMIFVLYNDIIGIVHN